MIIGVILIYIIAMSMRKTFASITVSLKDAIRCDLTDICMSTEIFRVDDNETTLIGAVINVICYIYIPLRHLCCIYSRINYLIPRQSALYRHHPCLFVLG